MTSPAEDASADAIATAGLTDQALADRVAALRQVVSGMAVMLEAAGAIVVTGEKRAD